MGPLYIRVARRFAQNRQHTATRRANTTHIDITKETKNKRRGGGGSQIEEAERRPMRTTRPHRSKGESPPLRWWRIEATAQLPLATSRKTKRAEAQGCYVRHLTTRERNTSFSRRKQRREENAIALVLRRPRLGVDPRVGSLGTTRRRSGSATGFHNLPSGRTRH